MKILSWSVTAIVSLALSSAMLAQSEEEATGTVVRVNGGQMFIDIGKGDETFLVYLSASCKPPKVGEKVKVHYEMAGGRKPTCVRIEKLGKSDKGSKKQ